MNFTSCLNMDIAENWSDEKLNLMQFVGKYFLETRTNLCMKLEWIEFISDFCEIYLKFQILINIE